VDAAALGVEDQLPPGMRPVTITDGGTWDAVNRKVKWFFNMPGQVRDRVLQYTVDCAGSVVTGVVNFGAGDLPVDGAMVFEGNANPGLIHPADDNGDWRIALSEVAASISRWRFGVDDLKTSIVIRGILLYLQGEQYLYDGQIPTEALRWSPITRMPNAADQTVRALAASRTIGMLTSLTAGAERSISLTNVAIRVTPADGISAWGLEEALPEGVAVSSISDEGTWDGAHRTIKWAFFDGDARTLSYSLTGPAGTGVAVTGSASFDGSEDTVTGASLVAFPLTFQTWATLHGMSGDPAVVFTATNGEYGQPNGLVYAFQANLQPGEPIIAIRWLDGVPVIEIPKQDASTLPYVEVSLSGTSDLTKPDWSLELAPAEDQSGAPANRCLWVPLSASDRAFFKVRAILK